MRNKKWDIDLVGELASAYEYDSRDSAFVNKTNTVQFSIRILSERTDQFPPQVETITGFANDLEKWGFEDDTLISDVERVDRLREFLQDSLLVFKPEKRSGPQFQEYYIASNIHMMGKKESYDASTELVPIPLYKYPTISETELRERLYERKYIGQNNHISKDESDTPSFLIWQGEQGEQKIYGEFDTHTYAHGGFRFVPKKDELKCITMEQNWREEIYTHENVAFIPIQYFDSILATLKEEEGYILKEATKEAQINEKSETKYVDEPEINEEDLFLKDLQEKTKELGLFYADIDLYNFHTAMKSQSLVILAGMSGTGKSQLVTAYAKALGLDNSQVNIIPVRPSWTDDTDLIGYPDTLNNVYRPGDSGLVNTLIRAENDPENLYIVCFDEMNLARVEHYFAQFLSVLEMEDTKKTLKLYNDDLQHRFYNGEQYRPSIGIRDNVIFVGTVNLDESTHHFSDKVLDRSNVIELQILPYEHLLQIEEKKELKRREKGAITTAEYNGFRCKNHRKVELSKEELESLWHLHETLQMVSKKLGIGPRVVKQIDKYIKNMPVSSPFGRKEAMDIQLVQRVLTKVRGPEELLLPLLGRYKDEEDDCEDSLLMIAFNRYKEVSDFTRAKQVVTEKSKELQRNGYTI